MESRLEWRQDLGVFWIKMARPGDEQPIQFELSLEEVQGLFKAMRSAVGGCQSCERLFAQAQLTKVILRGNVKPAPYKWLCPECETSLYTAWDRR